MNYSYYNINLYCYITQNHYNFLTLKKFLATSSEILFLIQVNIKYKL